MIGRLAALMDRAMRKYAATRPLVILSYRILSPATSGTTRAFQLGNWTSNDRYPAVFEFVSHQIGNTAERVLSFGCSTGEEVFTLREYFPRAMIKGIDVHALNVLRARFAAVRRGERNVRFERASGCDAEPRGHYDAVFCMAVLRDLKLDRNPPESCETVFKFSEFERIIGSFLECMKPGGFLVVALSNFRVEDTRAMGHLAPVLRKSPAWKWAFTPGYDANCHFVEAPHEPYVVFRKSQT